MQRVIEPFNHVDVYEALGHAAARREARRESTCSGNEMRVARVHGSPLTVVRAADSVNNAS